MGLDTREGSVSLRGLVNRGSLGPCTYSHNVTANPNALNYYSSSLRRQAWSSHLGIANVGLSAHTLCVAGCVDDN